MKLTDDEIIMAAYLMADGGVTTANTIFVNETTALIKEFIRIGNEL